MADVLKVNFPVGSNQKDETALIRIHRKKTIIKSLMHGYRKILNCSLSCWSNLKVKLYQLIRTQIHKPTFLKYFKG